MSGEVWGEVSREEYEADEVMGALVGGGGGGGLK